MNIPSQIALMQALDLPAAAENAAPDWIQLLPGGGVIQTSDNRGPYRVADPAAIVAAASGRALPVDENHAIDIKAARGESTPAVGRIVELQARDDGSIWGRAEWNRTGQELMADRAYVGISPVITHDGNKVITGILRASLTNKPNLRGMTALHMEKDDMSLSAVAKALGLAENAGEEQVLAAIGGLKPAAELTALQSQLGEIGVALGVAQDASVTDVLSAAKTAGTADHKTVIVSLQADLTSVTNQLNSLKGEAAKGKAEAFIDGEIKRGRVGVKPLRDHYIAMHMEDAARVEKEIIALPILGNGGSIVPAQVAKDGEVALQSAHIDAARALGIDPKDYAASLKAANEEAL